MAFDGSGRTYQVTSKPAGTYRYRVKACNPQGCGAYSAEAAITALHAPSVTVLSVPAASYNGSYAVSVSSVAQASSYRIEEQFNGGAWTEINRISGNQLAISGRIAGSYAYRAFACNDAGCSASSAVGAIVVTLPPVQATGINLDGLSYSSTVSMWWGAVPAATSYQLMEQLNGGGFSLAQEDGATSVARGGRWPGHWDYQVRGCNVAGCGPWSAVAGVRVIGPPATPILRVPDGVGIGAAYSISLLEVADATRYEIDESTDGANWTLIAGDRAVSLNKGGGGNFYYRGRACNPAGCSPSSAAGLVAISSAPAVPTGVRIVKSGPNICSVIWNASPGATYYNMRSSSGGATYRADGIGYDLNTRCQGATRCVPAMRRRARPGRTEVDMNTRKTKQVPKWLAAIAMAVVTFVGTATAQTVTYIHTDALGSPVAETDASGNVIKRYAYEPYGAVVGGEVTDGPGYTGHVSDAATGLSYMQQRYMDPQLGRFLSVDPVAADANKGDNFSRYKYANNNPYRFTDPDGRQERAAERFSDAFSSNPEAFEKFGPAAVTATQVAVNLTPVVGPVLGAAFRQVAKEPVAARGSAGGPRAGKDFTAAGKREVIQKNEQSNSGQTTCEGCSIATTPAQQSQRGVPTPKNETRVDHIIPKSKGGDGSPSNGQVLCSSCNINKSNKTDWIPPKDRLP